MQLAIGLNEVGPNGELWSDRTDNKTGTSRNQVSLCECESVCVHVCVCVCSWVDSHLSSALVRRRGSMPLEMSFSIFFFHTATEMEVRQ